MPARQVCKKFFRDALAPFHQYRQNALLDTTVALVRGASLTLTSIGRHLPGHAQVKHKIKRVDRLLGNTALHNDISLIFNNIISLLTQRLSFMGRVRGNIQLRLKEKGEPWLIFTSTDGAHGSKALWQKAGVFGWINALGIG